MIKEFYCDLCGTHFLEIEDQEALWDMFQEQKENGYIICECGMRYYYKKGNWLFYHD